jgi:DNA ligase-1
LFNPFVVTGISDKKIGKQKKQKILPMLAILEQNSGIFTGGIMDVLDYFKKNNTGRDVDVRFLVGAAEVLDFPELVYSIVKRDLKVGVQNTTLNKVFGRDFVPKFDVMLAERYADYADEIAGKEFVITEKLDGVRCVLVFENGAPAFFSRNGQAILDLTALTGQALSLDKEFVYDGELLLHNPDGMKSDELYRATVKITNRDGTKAGLIFNVFDMISKGAFLAGADSTPCFERKGRLAEFFNKMHADGNADLFVPVPILYRGVDGAKIAEWLDVMSKRGAEGIMLNLSDAPYECKRTKNLLKVKQFNTADVLVLDVEEGIGANRGKLGAVVVKFLAPDGKHYTCNVGSGFKLSERDEFWKNPELIRGKIIEIGYFELSRNQTDSGYSLRFPTFKHLRPDKTEISMY